MRKRMTLAVLAVTAGLVVSGFGNRALAVDANEMFADPSMEARARALGRDLRCLVCQNQSIFDSNAGLAKDLRAVVRERIEAGDTDGEVLDYVAARYGDYVLLNPPVNSNTALLWAMPAVLLLIAGAAGGLYLRGRSRHAHPTGLSPAERQAARRILEGEGS